MEDLKATSELVKEEISSSLFIKQALKKGLINYSALTRMILPKIKKRNHKANESSVLIAIQRYQDNMEKQENEEYSDILSKSEIIMKNKIVSLALERTKKSMRIINEVSKAIRWDLGDIMFFIQGSGEITIIVDEKNSGKFDALKSETLERKDNLAIISLRESDYLKEYSKEVVGYIALLTTNLSENGVNIFDIASTYKQVFFVVKEDDLTKAYNVFKKLIDSYK